ncbi:hypothetical protein ACFE04_022359 [Oxalis oulophora]
MDPTCLFCPFEEDTLHVLLFCERAGAVWSYWDRNDLLQADSIRDFFVLVFNDADVSKQQQFCFLIWKLWSTRNLVLWQDAHQRISRFTAGFDNQVQWTATVDGALFLSLGKSGFRVIFSVPDGSFLQAISGWFEGVEEQGERPIFVYDQASKKKAELNIERRLPSEEEEVWPTELVESSSVVECGLLSDEVVSGKSERADEQHMLSEGERRAAEQPNANVKMRIKKSNFAKGGRASKEKASLTFGKPCRRASFVGGVRAWHMSKLCKRPSLTWEGELIIWLSKKEAKLDMGELNIWWSKKEAELDMGELNIWRRSSFKGGELCKRASLTWSVSELRFLVRPGLTCKRASLRLCSQNVSTQYGPSPLVL